MPKKINLKALKEYLSLFALLGLAVLTMISPVKNSFSEGIKLWYACVLPTLFPYLFLTAAISENHAAAKLFDKMEKPARKLFYLNGAGLYAFFISLLSGSPIGAKTVADLYDAKAVKGGAVFRASVLCSTASPVFIIASVGKVMFNNVKFGLLLYLTHVVSAIITGVIFSFFKRNEKPCRAEFTVSKRANFLFDCAENSVITVLMVGGIIALFYVLTDVIAGVVSPILNLNGNLKKGIFFSVFECTKGLKYIAGDGLNFFSLPLCSAILGFGGLSIIAQSLAFLSKAKIKTAAFVFAKLLTAVINFFVGILFSLIFIV